MDLVPEPADEPTPLEATLARVGDRWSLLLVDALLGGPLRYNELQDAIPAIATNMLSQRLRHLEGERIVVATPYNDRPVRYRYELTAAGRELAGALRLLAQWSVNERGSGPEHAACGTSLDARWYCPTCDHVVDDAEISTVRYV